METDVGILTNKYIAPEKRVYSPQKEKKSFLRNDDLVLKKRGYSF